ncbi:MAG TPA: hypothetical protein VM452_04900 [Caulifigura sp.]|jgi:hypothetical protein|nr:hypothetical protein [Caulifigura sp.]
MKLDLTLLRAILAVGGLLTCGAGLANAEDLEDVGIVRISDHAPGAPCNSGCNTGGCNNGQCNTGCPSGYCGNGYCGNGCGNGCRSGCYHRCRCTGHVHRFLSWLDPCGGCTLPPDAGWSPPGKVAMWRRGVAYNKFFPDCWTGQPVAPVVPGMPRAQHVYMPTDTTQLGFYYQQVPYWQPVGGMIPAAPNPDDWHQPLLGDVGVVGTAGVASNCPAGAPAAAAAEPTVDAPAAPVADLSAANSAPTLQPIPR